jgi:hypothetical protein
MPRLIGSNTAPVPRRRGGDPNARNGAWHGPSSSPRPTRRPGTTYATIAPASWYYAYLRDNLATYKMLKIFKPSESIPDEAVTVQKCFEWMVLQGSPNRVLDQLVALVDEVGYFGTLLLTHKDWDKPELHKRSMVLLAEKVMPKLRQHLDERSQAAE